MKPSIHNVILASVATAMANPEHWVQLAAAAAAVIHAIAALRASQQGRKASERAIRAAATRKRAQGKPEA
jgi:hypothetical protein